MSISLAHYAGFLSKVPLQIVAASGSDLIIGVTGTFIFYISFCAIMSRVMVGILLPFLLTILLFAGRVEQGFRLKSISKKKKFIKHYNYMVANENIFVTLVQLVVFLPLMLKLYVDTEYSVPFIVLAITAILFVVLSGLFRTKFLLQCSWNKFTNRMKCRPVEKDHVTSAVIFTAISSLVILSYVMGLMRMDLLKSATPQQITNPYYQGYANLLASSGSFVLIYQHVNGEARYMYLASGYALAVESKPMSFPLLGSESPAPNKKLNADK